MPAAGAEGVAGTLMTFSEEDFDPEEFDDADDFETLEEEELMANACRENDANEIDDLQAVRHHHSTSAPHSLASHSLAGFRSDLVVTGKRNVTRGIDEEVWIWR